jgi:UDP-N-acetylglucosamine--N-acetylmuramyl-(pentapeptide) pyrophosphoryl-undecaprenol N-acetylglucosamine transferase
MDLAYELADIIISRAGAISISELCIVGKPVILVPYPHAAGNHQMKNAMSLVERNAAIMIEDDKAIKLLVKKAIVLINDKKRMNELGGNISDMAMPEASLKIAEEAIMLLK